ncbi:hypothetical protein Swit_3564 [Rhizorhabdus wittichii RW1]|uniref:DUF3325 domain-containing protein n=1 Tax=Rhizorhabdus wittichii (strain DSM 6014 / CCUG 31198 / JCM 15750 / NBRC 105917 / EY 4224 / RW1) TaxID=392499 RepID=A0A9J9HDZ5_RHIWR|nr:hypothetical protein Swit_3564 [Rhizorhabdus wittichii RW1]
MLVPILIPIFAIAFSTAIILILGRGDPKRRRTARLPGGGQSVRTRRLLAALACLPGLYCIFTGDAAAFFIWLGGCGVAGWFVALGFGQSRQDVA